jgi:hypothetical protein
MSIFSLKSDRVGRADYNSHADPRNRLLQLTESAASLGIACGTPRAPGDYILSVPQNSTSVILSSKIICDREALVRRTIIDDYDLEE